MTTLAWQKVPNWSHSTRSSEHTTWSPLTYEGARENGISNQARCQPEQNWDPIKEGRRGRKVLGGRQQGLPRWGRVETPRRCLRLQTQPSQRKHGTRNHRSYILQVCGDKQGKNACASTAVSLRLIVHSKQRGRAASLGSTSMKAQNITEGTDNSSNDIPGTKGHRRRRGHASIQLNRPGHISRQTM